MFFKRLFGLFIKKPIEPIVVEKPERPRQVMSPEDIFGSQQRLESLWARTFENAIHPDLAAKNFIHEAPGGNIKIKGVMDSKEVFDNNLNLKSPQYAQDIIPEGQLNWYMGQGFIGWQTCALVAQNWLIAKCCLMPAEDCARNGYELTVNDESKVSPEIISKLRDFDNDYRITKNLVSLIQMGRIFGIRVAMFKVESNDPKYYYKPFNIDGIKPGSYKGISQIDPYWLAYNFSAEAASDPSAIDFYVPTWWIINNQMVHKSHLVIYITEEVADILKPQYRYGGIPVVQKILERVYAAERTANEVPLLVLTKRTDVINIDTAQATAQPQSFSSRCQQWVYNRDNFGIKALGLDEVYTQHDTNLSGLDEAVQTQYQLVAAASGIPSVKLMGTSPKGFNPTGEGEEASYHEMLESLQEHALSPLLIRHYELLMRSEGMEPFDFKIVWEALDAMTAKEQAELNKLKADTGTVLMMSGAISGDDERDRLIADPESGYNGLTPGAVEIVNPQDDNEDEE